MIAKALLGGYRFDKFTDLPIDHRTPGLVNVTFKAHRFKLRQHKHSPQPAVHAIRQREVDDSINTAKRDGRFRIVIGEGFQTRTLATSEQHGCDARHGYPNFRLILNQAPTIDFMDGVSVENFHSVAVFRMISARVG